MTSAGRRIGRTRRISGSSSNAIRRRIRRRPRSMSVRCDLSPKEKWAPSRSAGTLSRAGIPKLPAEAIAVRLAVSTKREMDGELPSPPYRRRLPHRRAADTHDILIGNMMLTATIGFGPDVDQPRSFCLARRTVPAWPRSSMMPRSSSASRCNTVVLHLRLEIDQPRTGCVGPDRSCFSYRRRARSDRRVGSARLIDGGVVTGENRGVVISDNRGVVTREGGVLSHVTY